MLGLCCKLTFGQATSNHISHKGDKRSRKKLKISSKIERNTANQKKRHQKFRGNQKNDDNDTNNDNNNNNNNKNNNNNNISYYE